MIGNAQSTSVSFFNWRKEIGKVESLLWEALIIVRFERFPVSRGNDTNWLRRTVTVKLGTVFKRC